MKKKFLGIIAVLTFLSTACLMQKSTQSDVSFDSITYCGVDAVAFSAGGYEAMLIPSVGSNVVRLTHKESGAEVLRCPDSTSMEMFYTRPQIFGLPVLFPPNRIEDGRFEFEDRVYEFPITIVDQNNFHHGNLKSQPFAIDSIVKSSEAVEVYTSYRGTPENNPMFAKFPHTFLVTMKVRLSAAGLEQSATFTNLSETNMPMGMGFHTAFNIPFTPDGKRENYNLIASVSKQWELTADRQLPTGNLLELGEDAAITSTGICPFTKVIDNVYSRTPITVDNKPFSGCILTDKGTGISVRYEASDDYKFWTLWNDFNEKPYFCIEPQTWIHNAPNLKLPADQTGFTFLKPGESKTYSSKIVVEYK